MRMIKKEFKFPSKIEKLEAALRRVPQNHPRYADIQEEYAKRMAGYRGEQSLIYYLSLLDQEQYYIFHNLRLPDSTNDHFFEIDVLLITSTHIVIIDSKYLRGDIEFDHMVEQLIQTFEGERKAYPCPIAQVNRHQYQLNRLIQAHKLPFMPVEPLVAVTNPSSIVTVSPKHPHVNKIVKGASLQTKLKGIEQKYKREILNTEHMRKMARLLLKLHMESNENILEYYGIKKEEIKPGVFCPSCDHFPMGRSSRKWVCSACGHSSRTAHLAAIRDYVLLIGQTITNQQLREFLLLPSRSAGTLILKNLNAKQIGVNKGTVYHLE